MPPWSHDVVSYSEAGREAFRAKHGVADKFVVMYSGNHSPCHPLDTLLQSALALKEHTQIVFFFIGGSSEQVKVREFVSRHELSNVICLPYQPLDELSNSLSAADLHVVVMGEKFVGIVHPCKVYNIMSVGAPVLYIGPASSHITDIASQHGKFYLTRHGDVEAVTAAISETMRSPARPSAENPTQLSLNKMLTIFHDLSPVNLENPVNPVKRPVSSYEEISL